MDAPEAADYRTTLNELVANNKNTINLLTILAEDYSSIAPAIVDSIKNHLERVNRDQKLPTMYLTDSIIKNLQVPYKELFEKIIVKMFVHTFQNGDERVRSSLFKLRDTWKDIFSRAKMYELDIKVNQEDPNWPIETPTAGGAKASVKPTVGGAARPPVVAASDKKVHVNPKFMAAGALPAIKKDIARVAPSTSRTVKVDGDNEVKVEVKPILKKPVAISGRDPRAAKDPRAGKEKVEETAKKIKAEPIDEPMPSDPVQSIVPKKQVKLETDEAPVRNEGKIPEKKDERRKRMGDERREKRRDELDRSPPPKHSRRSPPRHANQRPMQQRPMGPMGVPLKPNVPPPPSRPHIPPPAAAVATPTNVVGSHAFSMAPRGQPSPPIMGAGKPPMHGNMSYPPPPVSMSSSLPLNAGAFVTGPIPGLLPPFASGPNNPFGPNRMPPPGPSGLPMGGPPPPMGGAPPFMAPPPLQRPPPVVPERKHVFKDDNRLEGIPANNRIFVDGKAYEVLYINEVAVIEKDGLPHRIYFQGIPRNVVIDGVAYPMSFGESREVMIDNDVHMIRFGAPSRELYMGDYPFKGAFGGPPIIATINGRRHEIRLAGPAPEVKIEPEPSYELSRFLVQARLESQQQMQPRPAVPAAPAPAPVKVEPKADLNSLLSKLKKSGIMNMLGKGEASPPPPIESDIRGGSDRAAAPVALFEKEPFDMRLLKTRYTSVVTALLAKRAVCGQCGLRFESLSGVRYEKHLDWHVRRNLAAATAKKTEPRAWYCSSQDWINAKDTAEDEDSGEGVDTFGKMPTLTQNARTDEDANKPSLNTDEAVSKTCAVCGEDFDEYFDSECDKWKLKDCMQMGGQTVHESCAPDLSRMEEETPMDTSATLKSEEEDDSTPIKTEEEIVSPSKMTLPVDPRLAAKSSPMA